MLVEHREFECIVEEVVVVLDVQVLVINFVGGDAAQFVKHIAFGACHMEVASDGLPTANLTGFHMEISTAVEHRQKAGLGETAY